MKITEIFENIKLAFEAIQSSKLRSLLASLGVVIGISFVIIMGWILEGLDSVVDDTFNTVGEDMLYLDRWDWSGGTNWKLSRQRKPITLEQAYELQARLTSAEAVIPNLNRWGGTVFKYGSNTYQGIQVVGVTHENALTPSGDLLLGRYFTAFEDEMGANVIVIGYTVYETIFPNEDPLGKFIQVNGHQYQIVGVVKKRGGMFLDFLDNQNFVPIKSFSKIFGTARRSVSIGIKAGGIENLDIVRAEAVGIMRTVRNLQPWDEDDFSVNETKAFERSAANLRMGVWAIGIGMTFLSFLVGVIGIMNIMFVSVAERTKEIGIRKAIGAKKSSILTQFIVEAAALCMIGAVISFVLCTVIIYLAATILPQYVEVASFLSPYIPLKLLAVAAFVSIFVGISAGYIPALRAANLDPVEAIRAE